MKAIHSFKTLIAIYQPTQPNIQEDLNLHQHHCANLKTSHYTFSFHMPALCDAELSMGILPLYFLSFKIL
jgi:hypothetical protein